MKYIYLPLETYIQSVISSRSAFSLEGPNTAPSPHKQFSTQKLIGALCPLPSSPLAETNIQTLTTSRPRAWRKRAIYTWECKLKLFCSAKFEIWNCEVGSNSWVWKQLVPFPLWSDRAFGLLSPSYCVLLHNDYIVQLLIWSSTQLVFHVLVCSWNNQNAIIWIVGRLIEEGYWKWLKFVKDKRLKKDQKGLMAHHHIMSSC